jgi:WD40 repeat protein/serine/threonine protein kinase
MPVVTVEQFFEVLQKSNLLPPGQLAAVRVEAKRSWLAPGAGKSGESHRGANAITPEVVARKLVERDLLTRWQADMLLLGRQAFFLGKYKLLEQLGSGGMGAVFKAQHVTMGRIVAVKILSPDSMKNQTAVARFHQEMEVAAKLDHPHIVAAYDADCVKEAHFLVMEYVPGQDLGRVLRRNPVLPIGWSCEVTRQAALGLQHAHECGMVHRDIKPTNLLISKEDGSALPHVKILDMGLSRFVSETGDDSAAGLTQTGVVVGTPDYIAPEQAANTRSADIRSDIFSLGCTLFRMLTGRLPYAGHNVMEKLMARAMKDAPRARSLRPEIPQELDDVIAKMLARDPGQRFQSPKEVSALLAAFSLSSTMGVGAARAAAGMLPAWDPDNTPADKPPVPPESMAATREVETGRGSRQPATLTEAAAASADVANQPTKITPGRADDKSPTELGIEVFLQHLATEAELGETPSLARRIVEQHSAKPQRGDELPGAATAPTTGSQCPIVTRPKSASRRLRLLARSAWRDRQWRAGIGLALSVAVAAALGLLAWNWLGQTRLIVEWRDEERTDGRLELDGQPVPFPARGDIVFVGSQGSRKIRLTRPGYDPIEKSFQLQRGDRVVFTPEWVPNPQSKRRLELADLKMKSAEVANTDPWDNAAVTLRESLVDFRRRHAGPEDALTASQCLAAMPSPLDRFRREGIDAAELKAATIGRGDKGPAGLVAILGHSRFKHWGPVRSLAFGRQGEWLASAGDDQAVRLWNASTGELLRVLDAGDRGLQVLFSPDAAFVAVAGENNGVLMWRVEGSAGSSSTPPGRPFVKGGDMMRRTLPDSAWPVAFSPGGKTVVTHSRSGPLLLWDLDTGERLLTFTDENPTRTIKTLVFSPDGQRFASYSRLDQSVRVWRVTTGALERTFLRAHWPLFRPGGTTLAAETENDTLTLWDLDSGAVSGVLRGTGRPLRFSANGEVLATHGRGELKLWDVSAGRERGRPRSVGELMQISPSLQSVAEWDDPASPVGAAGRLEFLTLPSGVERRTAGHPGGVLAADFSADGQVFATGGGDHAVRLWSPASGAEPRRTRTSLPGVLLCDISPDARWLALACDDSTLRLLELTERTAGQNWKTVDTKTLHDGVRGVTALRFSPDGRMLAAIGDWAALTVFDSDLRSRKAKKRAGADDNAKVSPNTGAQAAGATTVPTAMLKLWDVETANDLALAGASGRGAVQNLRCLAFSPDGKSLAAGTGQASVLVWEVASLAARGAFFKHGGAVESLAFSPNGKQIASTGTGADKSVLIWNPLTGSVQHALESESIRGPVRALAFHPEGKLLATGGDDHFAGAAQENYVTVWDTASGASKHQLRVPGGRVRTLAFSPLGDRLATGNAAGQVHVWNVPFRSPRVADPDLKLDVGPSGGIVRQVRFAPDGRHVIVVNGDGTLSVFRLKPSSTASSLAKSPAD